MEQAARSRLVVEGPAVDPDRAILDSDRFAAPLAERLDARGRVQLVLWGSMLVVFGLALVSFFSAPLMDFDTAIAAVLVAMMLFLSYVM
jgi:hypothetical protein